ncbi:hypothetical protein ACFY19_20805 [Streptosporangium saharense]|uniref:hypothetical protein n=1 Tax=Streptosporangium saharense TaxID=1706840 RepID=UPI00369A178A
MLPLDPVSLDDAAVRLDVPRSTVGVWVHRYKVRRVGTVARRAFIDFWDLAAVEMCLRTGRTVPATPADRDALRHPAAA